MSTRFMDTSEIIVPLDGRDPSIRAVPVAVRLGREIGRPVRLFSSSHDPDEQLRWLQAIAGLYSVNDDVSVSVSDAGDPAEAIVETAGATGLICMATAASLLPHQGRIGSVAEDVVRRLERPVALVGPEMEPQPGNGTERVVVPVDGSELSEASLDIAADLAETFGVPLWIVTVISHRSGAAVAAQVGNAAPLVELSYVNRLARDLANRRSFVADFDVLHGDNPARAIVDFTGDDGTVVMSTHGRSGLSRLFGGSVATGVVAHSKRAVFVWRPDESS